MRQHDQRISDVPGRLSLVEVELEKWAAHEEAVAALAPRLGLDAATVDVRNDDEAGRRVAASGASGLADGSVVYLSPDRYDATTERGRYLLAHELTHVAQARLATVVGAHGSRAEAEAEAAEIGHAWAGGRMFAAPQVALPAGVAADTDADQMAKARPAAQSDFVLRLGDDAFTVSFELASPRSVSNVRVVVSPTDFARTKQPLYKYWDVRGHEVSKDDSYTTMANVGADAQPWSQQVPLSTPKAARFEPIILTAVDAPVARRSLESAAKLWTFDWDGDGKPEYSVRIGYFISNTEHWYSFTAWADGAPVASFQYSVIPDDAWKYGGSGFSAPRREQDDLVDFLGGILTSKTTWEMAITMIPVIGEVVLLGEAITGYTIFGDKMSNTERVVSGLAVLLPVVGGVLAKGGADITKLAAKLGRSEVDTMALLKAAEKQGIEAATVAKWRATLKAGGDLTVEELSSLQRMVHQLDADQRMFRAAEEEMGASRILRKGGKLEQTGPVSLKRLRTTLGRLA
ncbi:MAG TPA: DUF4157 domain-containing protein [Kofleriaceae bacterium]|jgi:hypothetical protein|nr:DUF4157 domain-containing protein [Kofleriaceae bacterium]